MIIKTRVESSSGAMRTVYYKYMSISGKPTLGSKSQAAVFGADQAAKVLEHLKIIDHRFAEAELVE